MNPGTGNPAHILSGWKDIANYLGKGVRTVQRYEQELRLPVRRPAGRVRGSVVATTTELDAWVTASPIREEFQPNLCLDLQGIVSWEAVRQGIRKMRVLQQQMRSLGAEVKRSMCRLQENIETLQGGVRKDDRPLASVGDVLDRSRKDNTVLDMVRELPLQ